MMIRRLNYAFTDLWHQGIIGGPEIYSDGAGCLIHMMERADVEAEAGREIIGICFYNDVASENLDETGTLQLDWYPYESSWDFGYEIASKIQAALENRGLMTRWEGHEKMTAQECIEPNKIEIYGLKKPWDNPWDAYWPPCD